MENTVNYGFNHNAAAKYGIPGAMILNRIVWSQNYHMENKDEYYFKEGRWWVCNTYESIAEHYRGLISRSTIQTKILAFEKDSLVISKQMAKGNYNRTKWYTVDIDRWGELINREYKNCTIDSAKQNPGYRWHKNCAIDSTATPPIDGTKIDLSTTVYSLANSLANSHTKHPLSPTPPNATLSAVVKYNEHDLQLASEWLQFSKELMPWKKAPISWTPERWADDLAKVKRVTDINDSGLNELFKFIKGDDFWCKNTLSPNTLLKKGSNGNRKIDNILLKMRPTGDIKRKRVQQAIEDFANDPTITTPQPVDPEPEVHEPVVHEPEQVKKQKNSTVTSSFSQGLRGFKTADKENTDD